MKILDSARGNLDRAIFYSKTIIPLTHKVYPLVAGDESAKVEVQLCNIYIVENRYNKAAIILAGQISHTKWYELFPDPTIAGAIMDRIVHNAYILALNSKKSMRKVMAEKIVGTT